jgi:hypothetical protein
VHKPLPPEQLRALPEWPTFLSFGADPFVIPDHQG